VKICNAIKRKGPNFNAAVVLLLYT
jgi:hypothetical protein